MSDILFQSTGGVKVRCTVCGRTGYEGGPWQKSCRAGHPFLCACGRRFATKQALSTHTWKTHG